MLDNESIESYKAQQMRTFLEFWIKLCPDHRISIRDGVFSGSGLCIEFSDSFAERIRFNSPAIEVADRERVLEVQLECDQLRAKADAFDNITRHQEGMDKHDVNNIFPYPCPEKLEPNEG